MNEIQALRGGVRGGGLEPSVREELSESRQTSEGDGSSGEEQVVFGEDRSEVSIEVPD